MASLAGGTNGSVSLAAEHAVLESAQPEVKQCDQQTPTHAAEAPAKAVLQHYGAEGVVNVSSRASERCCTTEQGHAVSNTQAQRVEHMPANKSSVEAVNQACCAVEQAQDAPEAHRHLVENAEALQQADLEGLVMPPPPTGVLSHLSRLSEVSVPVLQVCHAPGCLTSVDSMVRNAKYAVVGNSVSSQ